MEEKGTVDTLEGEVSIPLTKSYNWNYKAVLLYTKFVLDKSAMRS